MTAALRGCRAYGGVRGPGLMRIFREAIILFYLPALDPDQQKMTELAEWVFCSAKERTL